MNDQPTRREKRAQERKQHIMFAAAKLIAQKGFSSTTTKDIAEAAAVAEGTIYNYFANKDDILIQLVNHLADLENRAGELEELVLGEDDFFQAVLANVEQRMQFVQEAYPFYLAILPEILSSPHLRELYQNQFMQPINGMLEAFLAKGVEHGYFNPMDITLTARLVSSMMMGFQVLHILGDEGFREVWENHPRHFAEVMMGILFKGIRKDSA